MILTCQTHLCSSNGPILMEPFNLKCKPVLAVHVCVRWTSQTAHAGICFVWPQANMASLSENVCNCCWIV